MIQWLADEPMAWVEKTLTWWFNSLQVSWWLEQKEQQLVNIMAWTNDDNNDDNDKKYKSYKGTEA